MSLRVLLVIPLLVAHVVSCKADDAPPAPARPTSTAAAAALKEYDRASQVADDACRAAKMNADKKLIEKLKIAMTAAAKAGNLDEANLINAQIKLASARLEAESPAASIRGQLVERAVYTPVDKNKKGVDVTPIVRSYVKNGTLQITANNFSDPDAGKPKVLVIDGVWGGAPFTIQIGDPAITRFVLGPYQGNAN